MRSTAGGIATAAAFAALAVPAAAKPLNETRASVRATNAGPLAYARAHGVNLQVVDAPVARLSGHRLQFRYAIKWNVGEALCLFRVDPTVTVNVRTRAKVLHGFEASNVVCTAS